jgi:type IV secretion system protein VirB4
MLRSSQQDDFLAKHFDMGLAMPEPDGLRQYRREMPASKMIPYMHHYDDHTVLTKDDAMLQVIKLDGIYFDSFSNQDIKTFERQRNTVLRTIANSNKTICVHLIRKRSTLYPEGEGGTWFSRLFNQRWREHYKKNQFFQNEIYITVVRKRFMLGMAGWANRIGAFFSGAATDDVENQAVQAEDLYDATDKIVQMFKDYGARLLKVQRLPEFDETETANGVTKYRAMKEIARFQLPQNDFFDERDNNGLYPVDDLLDYLGQEFTELGNFFYYLINLENGRVPVSSASLDAQLAASHINHRFLSRMMEVEGTRRSHAVAVCSMYEWPERTPSKMLNTFLETPAEFIITQTFEFVDRIAAESDMNLEIRRKEKNEAERAEEEIEDIKGARKELVSGRSVDGWHHLSVLVHVEAHSHSEATTKAREKTLRRLSDAVSLVDKAFITLNAKPVRESMSLQSFYWSQLPGQNTKYIPRRGRISSANFAGFMSLHNYATGKIAGNLWGSAIMPVETESKTAYMLNFHRELEGMVAGHTLITADTGSGKTALLSALIAMADKARPRVFWFDNRYGAVTFMEAMGGVHSTLSPIDCMGWNPFLLPDTNENRAFLRDLVVLMLTCYGEELLTEDYEKIAALVKENYTLPKEERRLKNVAWVFGKTQGGGRTRLSKLLAPWHGDGANAGVFDNAEDIIDFEKARHYCFEMSNLIVDGDARPELTVMQSYMFHRINQAMNGDPFIIVLEEGQNLVKHEFWQKKIDSFIMQIRRLNGILIFITPDPKYIYQYVESLDKQTATKIFLPNKEAKEVDYIKNLGLTRREFDFIKDTPPSDRKFLIRRGAESIRAVFDLSVMPEFIPILSSNKKGVELMRAIQRELDTKKPEEWVPVFMVRSMEENTHNLRPN